MCSSKPPRPDPLIGQAARQQADIAQQQLEVARRQLEWEKDRAKAQDPLIQKIIESQGGHIWVDSAEGAGTTFRFTWPKRPQEG